MLASCYEVNGVEHARYHHAVRHLLGRKSAIVVSVFQIVNLFFFSLIFTITASNCMVEIANLACQYQGKTAEEIASSPSCLSYETGGVWKMSLVFGGIEMLFSQIKNLEEAWWSSLIGSVSGVVYVLIILIIGFAHVSNGLGSISGITTDVVCTRATGTVYQVSVADKVFGILNGLGTIAFCFNFSLILLEVQNTLKQPPSAVKQMKKTCVYAISSSFFCYFMVAVTGYAAEGDCVDSIVINSFSGPKWALIICYIMVLANMITSYQVFGQSMFETIESQVKWYLIRHKLRLAQKSEQIDAVEFSGDSEAKSPFDTSATVPIHKKSSSVIDRLGSSYGFDHTELAPLSMRLSTAMSGPASHEYLSEILSCSNLDQTMASGRESSLWGAKSGLRAMFSHDTGFANEEVPLNDEGYLLPFVPRALIRCTYVGIITILACVLPFFESIAGLSGAVSFYPMSIYFPFAMYKQLNEDEMSKRFKLLLRVIEIFTFTVGCCATVGSFRNIIVSWSSFQIFNT
jgi:hypothetical protein